VAQPLPRNDKRLDFAKALLRHPRIYHPEHECIVA
jgi:hypothetical protein